MTLRSRAIVSVALVALWVQGCTAQTVPSDRAVDSVRLAAAAAETESWLSYGRTYDEQRFSPLDHVNSDTVGRLGLAWSYDTGRGRGHEATPLVEGGVMYFTSSFSVVYAVDARTGEELWIYDPDVPGAWARNACCDAVNRGVALWEGHVFLGTLDGRLVKIDATTGEVVWEINTIDRERPYTITGAPRVVKGRVIIGNGGAEYGVRGYVSAYDVESGDLAWRFFTVPGDPSLPFEHDGLEQAAETWSGEWWIIGGGGTVWDSMAFDPELDLLYVGTGNGTPWSRTHRSPGGGDNLYLSSILALDPDDGRLVWHYQTTPADNWDYTATQHIVLADLEIEGARRRVLMQAPKNGFFFVLDRETGELISAEKYSVATWATHVDMETGRPVEAPEGYYDDGAKVIYPAPGGAHNWQPMAFHPGTGLVYIPSHERSGYYGFDEEFEYTPGGNWNLGTGVTKEEEANEPQAPRRALLLGWDPVAQEARWSYEQPSESNGGLLATAGDLVFQGTSDGRFAAFDAASGDLLWSVQTDVGILAAPITYELDGEQYVSVLAGYGGVGGGPHAIAMTKENPGRLFTFKLDATAPIPEVPDKKRVLASIDEPQGTPEQIENGARLYGEHCSRCHGSEAVGRGFISDLRYSRTAVHEGWDSIVLDGRYSTMGMDSFADVLSAEDSTNIHRFVVAQMDLARAES
ncbi:MAG: PQQ-dependent dehydrogenase, methanol/ethanol family [Acidobacteriota bacterium]